MVLGKVPGGVGAGAEVLRYPCGEYTSAPAAGRVWAYGVPSQAAADPGGKGLTVESLVRVTEKPRQGAGIRLKTEPASPVRSLG